MRSVLLAALMTALGVASTVAQSGSSAAGTGSAAGPAFLGSAGIGAGPLGFAWHGSVGLGGSFGEIRLRAAGATDVNIDIYSRPGRHDESYDVALVYGRRFDLGSPYWLRVSAGPAFVRSVGQWEFLDCMLDCPGPRSANSAGVAGGLAVGRGRFSIHAFGDVNENRSFWGVTVDFNFGAGR